MNSLKTYNKVNRADANASFGISRMEEIYEKRLGKADEPHRHDFFTILLIKQGAGTHHVDFNSYEVKNQQVYFIGPGQVHQLIEHQQPLGFSLVFSPEFLVLNQISIDFIEDINLFHYFGDSPPLNIDKNTMKSLSDYCEQMLLQHQSNSSFKYEAVGALLKLFLIKCHSQCTLNELDVQTQESGGTLLRNFKKLLNANFSNWHQTSSYAEALHITPDHLNRVVKSLTGKTSKEQIQNRIIIAAKRMLHFTPLSNKEISFELGFSEPANFSAFFKKCTGLSPSEFKSKA